MYILLVLLPLCLANFEEDGSDYWYSNDDGIVEDANYPDVNYYKGKIQNNAAERMDLRDEYDMGFGKNTTGRTETDKKQVLKLLQNIFNASRCVTGTPCMVKELEIAVNYFVNTLPLLRIAANLKEILDDAELVEEKVLNGIRNLNDNTSNNKILNKVPGLHDNYSI